MTDPKALLLTYCCKYGMLSTVDASDEKHIWHERSGILKSEIVSKQPDSSPPDEFLVRHIRTQVPAGKFIETGVHNFTQAQLNATHEKIINALDECHTISAAGMKPRYI